MFRKKREFLSDIGRLRDAEKKTRRCGLRGGRRDGRREDEMMEGKVW
jgi:hypothetical protein